MSSIGIMKTEDAAHIMDIGEQDAFSAIHPE